MSDQNTGGARVGELLEAVRDYLASGEQHVPAVLAALPVHERERLLAAAREFRDTIAARVAHLEQARGGR